MRTRNEVEPASAGKQRRDVGVARPNCDRTTTVRSSIRGGELRARGHVAAFGEYDTARRPEDHEFRIYYC